MSLGIGTDSVLLRKTLLSTLLEHHTVSFNGKTVFIDVCNECIWGCNEYGVESYVSSSVKPECAVDWLLSDTSQLDERGNAVC